MISIELLQEFMNELQHSDISIEHGRVCVTAHDYAYQSISDLWLISQQENIGEVVSSILGREVFEFNNHTTGQYGTILADGVTLHFIAHPQAPSDPYCVFNAKTRYVKGAKVGKPLPKKRFTPPKRGKFVRLYRASGLPAPRRPSEYHEYMHLLKGVFFLASRAGRYKDRLDKDSIKPVNLSAEQVRNELNHLFQCSAELRQSFGNQSAISRHDSSAPISLEPNEYNASSQFKLRTFNHGTKPIGATETGTERTNNLNAWLDDHLIGQAEEVLSRYS
jgi:hypothetical protein